MIEIWVARMNQNNTAVTQIESTTKVKQWDDLNNPVLARMCRWIQTWLLVRDGYIPQDGTTAHTPCGLMYITRQRTVMYVFAHAYESLMAHRNRNGDGTMIHIAVLDDVTMPSHPIDLSTYRAYYIVEKPSDIHEDHETACRLLDAAADEHGSAYLHGLGSRVAVQGLPDVHYVLSSKYIERYSDGTDT